MALYQINPEALQYSSDANDIDDALLNQSKTIDDLSKLLNEVYEESDSTHCININDIITFFDTFSDSCTHPDLLFTQKFGHLGLSFLIYFLKKESLRPLLDISLKGDIEHLNDFVFNKSLNKFLMAHPRGNIVHWLAGNIPVLGMLSLVQGVLTRNCNIVKLPKSNGRVLPYMIAELYNHKCKGAGGSEISGRDILRSIVFLYCNRDDIPAQHELSKAAHVRVAWGGREAVEAVMSSPKRYSAVDVVFGPKYSFVIIGKDSFDPKDLKSIAMRVAMDASVFEQQGCNSPHTVFVEEGWDITPEDFAEALAEAMDKILKRVRKQFTPEERVAEILNIRAKYDFIGNVYSSKGVEWTVVFSEEEGVAKACYYRTLFVRPIGSINDVLSQIDHSTQTVGLAVNDSVKMSFARHITKLGVERITDLGKMSAYEHPWDGFFPMENFVRWVSVYK